MAGRKYLGLVINRERLERNWSQEDLCKGICTISYLSKIETGKADPSEDILNMLFKRLGLVIDENTEKESIELSEQAYKLLFSGMTDNVRDYLREINLDKYRAASAGLDLLLIKKIIDADGAEIQVPPEGLTDCMDHRQIAMYRIIQGRQNDAVLYYPNAYTYLQAGLSNYQNGQHLTAISQLQTSYDLASRDGLARIMLEARMSIGNCYFNQFDSQNMYAHYKVASNLAYAMNDQAALAHISYYLASTQISLGEYDEAYSFFSKLENPGKLQLHKLAICCEKTGRKEEGIAALDRADAMHEGGRLQSLVKKICAVVRYRLEHEDYLNQEEYGEMLLSCYNDCLKERPLGFDVFHLPWMIEWFKSSRQYKKACELLSGFPGLAFMNF